MYLACLSFLPPILGKMDYVKVPLTGRSVESGYNFDAKTRAIQATKHRTE